MNNKRKLKIAVVDCSVSGHRETYYRTFATVWAGMGHEVLLLAPQPSGTEEETAFRRIDICPLRPLPANRPLQKKLEEHKTLALDERIITLKGMAIQADEITEFAQRLQQNPLIQTLTLIRLEQETETPFFRFHIRMSL